LLSQDMPSVTERLRVMFPRTEDHILARWEFCLQTLAGVFAAWLIYDPKTPRQDFLAGAGSGSILGQLFVISARRQRKSNVK
jgi:hypothetical protein